MPSPFQSNCDAHDTIANGQYGAVWSMGHSQQDDISVFCRRRTSNTTSPCRLLHIPVVLNDFHSRETTLNPHDPGNYYNDWLDQSAVSYMLAGYSPQSFLLYFSDMGWRLASRAICPDIVTVVTARQESLD
ncbi:hypothetical protein TNCV_293921 [Trichonephila clavipes]|nr:hypothetical protein TNCV_293921 [Trichonephila clavipes]